MKSLIPEHGFIYQLTMQAGAMPGAAWAIQDTPLIIGRSKTCHVILNDALVSRTHCSVQRVGDGLRLRDLGSSNPCLVNGKPSGEATLLPGDRLSVGNAVFLVTALQSERTADPATPGKTDTLRLGAADIPLLRTIHAPDQIDRLPKTARDYAALFQFSLDCAACADSRALMDRLAAWLRQHFAPGATCVYETRAGGLDCVLQEPPDSGPLDDAVLASVLEDRRARLLHTDTANGPGLAGQSMVAPMLAGGELTGILAVSAPAERPYYREDLELFAAFAHVFSPYLSAVDERERLREANARLRAQFGVEPHLIGKSKVLHAVRLLLRQAAEADDLPVLLLGETGTGKELAARQIHAGSARAAREMIVVNCAAIPDELFESEFFGHVRGAFTGAVGTGAGLVAAAEGSTLLLDEIAELSPPNQAKLLRFVETNRYRPVGDARERPANVRIVAATNAPLPSDGFRMDLFHRLSGFVIHLPPLRQHAQDIPRIAEHFRAEFAPAGATACRGFTPEALDLLSRHDWPGNVRELRLRILRAVRTTRAPLIDAKDLAMGLPSPEASAAEGSALTSLSDVERDHIARVLAQCHGDTQQAAAILGIARSTMYKKIHDYGLK